ncbi:MAG: adenylyl-sulfate kinase [Alphaproteobacteria bacterium]|nr:adenylyl-sulfate kinase [Alphaproteobacteria bacterium]
MTQSADTAGRQLAVVVVGHVDHGKSTLVGRLFYDTGMLPEGRAEAIRAMCERRGMPFEWAFLMDAFKAERDQGITIDTAQIWFKTAKRDYVLIDAPGHREFLRNMITGASAADAAVLLIDAAQGVRQQSRHHGYLLHLLGVEQVAVVVNKMDTVDYAEARFAEIRATYSAYLASLGIKPSAFIPVVARDGDNLVERSARMGWYGGPTIVEAMDAFRAAAPDLEQPLRLPLQDVYKFDERRILVGRIESGRLAVGDTLLFSPSNKTARVASIEAWNVPAPPARAEAGRSVGITLDDQLFVERGEMASHVEAPPIETTVFRARLFWMSPEKLAAGQEVTVRIATREVKAVVQAIERVVDTETLEERAGDAVPRDGIADVVLRARQLVALDEYRRLKRTGRCVIVDRMGIAGGGLIGMEGYPDQRLLVTPRASNLTGVEHGVTKQARAARNGHVGGVLWFTGLSGSGKSTLAMEVERRLFEMGYQVYVLDGDNVRRGVNANLGFSPEDRAENIRRVGELAALFADAGTIAIAAFISPYRADRERARAAARDTSFHEIFIKAELAVCEGRDPKGLYKKARAGQIAEFTGISAPYEEPERPELVVDTGRAAVAACAEAIVAYVARNFALKS